jgi:DNA topoisomerase-2
MTKKTQKYSKMNPLEHILHRPDTYVGSTRSRVVEEYVSHPYNNFKITKRNIKYSPAILRTFIEPLSNAIDNVARSKNTTTPCTSIKISICKETGETIIWNDGECIPIEINDTEQCYNHTLIFGELLTSSNYNDNEERYNVSGRNGLGVKLTSVFSKIFKVRGIDPVNGLKLKQEWKNNMKYCNEPEVKKTKLKKGCTEVNWIPDFSQFKMTGYTDDIIDLYCKYAVDTAMLTGVKVYFNNVLIPVKNMKDYAKLYSSGEENKDSDLLYINEEDSQVVLMPWNKFEAISFVNGIYTSLGGTHVTSWSGALFRPIIKKLNKTKNCQFTLADIKKFFRIFVVCKVNNPEFESQSKHLLETPVKVSVKQKYITTLLKWSVIEDIKRSKEMILLKKIERKKKNFVKIEGLDPANNEGGVKSRECTLILVEGLSAKTYAVLGIEKGAIGKKGRDWFGIYPLRGKLLNVRNAKAPAIAKNKVLSDIIKALGVQHDLDYTKEVNYKKLRYGKVMIITDADVDGIHISGLIQNLFHSLFPSLLERKDPFIVAMQTPIVKVIQGKKSKLFYDEREYKKFVKAFNIKNPMKKINKKYYKGLGSSSAKDIKETFGRKIIQFYNDENAHATMTKVFHSSKSHSRKDWLKNYDSTKIALSWKKGEDEEVLPLVLSDFLNTEMIKFSINDCQRSIPHILDGLKVSQRKVLYSCFEKKLKYSGKTLKVAQLAGYVAEVSGYHHGEQNLYDTITKMAHNFVGSNNIPLLYRDGQFGSRLSGGKDAANARYIHTKLDCLTRILFNPLDDVLLDRVIDDGDIIEPHFYIPILPVILINGCIIGIGTGWSCSVPCYNPLDIVKAVKCWIKKESYPSLHPWYYGYQGDIKKTSKNDRYVSWGNISNPKKNTVIINELPIGMWTDTFKNFLDGMLVDKVVNKVKNYSTPSDVKFVITESKNGIKCNTTNLKLHKYIYTSNMVLFTSEGKIKKFNNVNEIIDEFCTVRLSFYKKRKKYILDNLKKEIKYLGNKKRFLEAVIEGDILLFQQKGHKRISRSSEDILKELEEKKYDKDPKEGTYDYLLRIQVRGITKEKIDSLRNDIESKLNEQKSLESKTPRHLWNNDLDYFTQEYKKFFK